MPFSGIKPGSELEKKIDRCMARVLARRPGDKSRAIAICRAAVPGGKTATKDQKTAVTRANYTNAGPASTKICQTCSRLKNGRCSKFDFKPSPNYVCNEWLPNIKALQKRGKTLATETKATSGIANASMSHGPGGLLSTLGLGGGRKPKKRILKKIAIANGKKPTTDTKSLIKKMTAAGMIKGGKLTKKGRDLILKLRKKATTKASRGGAEQRAMFAKMGASGSAYPRTGGKRMSPSAAADKEITDFLDSIDSGGSGGVEDQILPPSGKAPTGQGKEYQTRRWIHSRINKFEDRKTSLRNATRADTDTKRDRQRASRNQIAIDSINQSLEVARHVIKNLLDAGDDFTDSKELFSQLFSLPAGLLGGL